MAPAIIDAEFEPQTAHVPLAHYLWILRRHAWKIIIGVVATTVAALMVCLRLTPIYESTVTIDIDRRMPTGVLGQEAAEVVNNDARPVPGDASEADPIRFGAEAGGGQVPSARSGKRRAGRSHG